VFLFKVATQVQVLLLSVIVLLSFYFSYWGDCGSCM